MTKRFKGCLRYGESNPDLLCERQPSSNRRCKRSIFYTASVWLSYICLRLLAPMLVPIQVWLS
ncbi:uncharacterized protein BO95DRAFT_442878 [Aspergillus brunneoviolaceus CBS 621.78]|uniref:Uncharacterized protein n=1 Tax=Aspergillus brunneoviolaceus CBS 621.78 TaxID=1450534 RepID=A0ACD1G944_9EURO|nr:hypothetical protein BO95DRAFT_442878 [Aspergillus brunneoviolaceus CBS 621.78]RAH45763.1 hypothetical protein BO95DRAFT_442878 [Aspergillus brunneoviolaceus CBS 621.78]